MTTLTAKEQFFRTILVPVAQIARALGHNAYFSDVFNQVSFYVINPNTTADLELLGESLTKLKMNILDYAEIDSCESRAKENWAEVKDCFRLRKVVTAEIERLIAQIQECIGYSDGTRESFHRLHSLVETPITIGGRRTKWKTFVRHLGFNETMAAHSLTERIKHVKPPKYTSNMVAYLAPALWKQVFGIEYDVNNLPTRAAVRNKRHLVWTALDRQSLDDSELKLKVAA